MVTSVQAAVEDRASELDMIFRSESEDSEVVAHRPDVHVRQGDRGRIRVPTRRLDDLVDECGLTPGEIALVWADVQGSEPAVIRTGSRLWAHGVPLYLEVEPALLERHGGIQPFESCVRENFVSFVPRDVLVGHAAVPQPAPIGEFSEWVGTIKCGEHSDALLIPTSMVP
jgi:hypothetical protein